jgi:hypothetical protein
VKEKEIQFDFVADSVVGEDKNCLENDKIKLESLPQHATKFFLNN